MTRTLNLPALAVGVLAIGGLAIADQHDKESKAAKKAMGGPIAKIKASAKDPVALTAEEVAWGDGPAGLPAGARMAILVGDPRTPDRFFAVRFEMPADYEIKPHWHPADEHVTVISGEIKIGHGDKFDLEAARALPAGSYFVMPAKHHHYAATTRPTVIQLEGIGPWGINYINPKDDPRKQQAMQPDPTKKKEGG